MMNQKEQDITHSGMRRDLLIVLAVMCVFAIALGSLFFYDARTNALGHFAQKITSLFSTSEPQ